MIAASCPTALGALCGQLTFRLAWCWKNLAVMVTELLQPLDLACGTLFQSSCAIQTSVTYKLFRQQLKRHLFWTQCSVNSDMRHLRKTLTYCRHNISQLAKILPSLLCGQFCALCLLLLSIVRAGFNVCKNGQILQGLCWRILLRNALHCSALHPPVIRLRWNWANEFLSLNKINYLFCWRSCTCKQKLMCVFWK